MKKTGLTGLEIAVIGYAGRFNNCPDADEYWKKLRNEEETFHVFKEDELRAIGIPEETYKKQNYIPVRGDLSGKDCFDARFFGYTPDEAYMMDPQVRLFHEIVWQGLEMAGYSSGKGNKRIGIYAAASNNPIWQVMMALNGNKKTGGFETAYLSSTDYLCSLVGYKLNLRGPAVFVQTACSSSLVAVHQAVRGVLTGDCDMAVAGGISASLLDEGGYLYEENLIYSSDGHCRAFDAGASGTLKGEGGGVVILKKYQDAIRDHDTIYGIIKGSAINNDGNEKLGFTAPGVHGQRKVIRQALRIAGVDPDTVSYIETHGTGTRLGDPVEFKAMNDAYGPAKRNKAAIGSVKTNIGHLDASAGVASLIKVLLMLKHRQIPGSLHFKDPNPAIDFDGSPFYVNDRSTGWVSEILRAGISSFGIGGTNCHMIVEEPPAGPARLEAGKEQYVFNLSARTPQKLNEIRANLAQYLTDNPSTRLSDMAYTLNVGRQDFSCRQSVVAATADELAVKLTDQGNDPGIQVKNKEDGKKRVVFLFSGQGAQYRNMGKELYDRCSFFREQMQDIFSLIARHHGIVLEEILFSTDETDKRINETLYAQLSLFAISYPMALLLKRAGIEPAALAGHSIGEYVAAVVAGIMTPEEAVRIIGKRAYLMQGVETGKMYTVFAGEDQVRELMNDQVAVAAVNAPGTVVVSGNHQAMDELAGRLTEKNILLKRLHTSHAFHSPMMEGILEEYALFLREFSFREGNIPVVSNVSGQFFSNTPDADYWCRHVRETVRFCDSIQTLLAAGYTAFIEVGPGNQLVRMIEEIGKEGHFVVENTIRPVAANVNDHAYLLQKVSALWRDGWTVDWDALYEGGAVSRIALPTYPFENTKFPLRVKLADLIKDIHGASMSTADASEWLYHTTWTVKNPAQPANTGAVEKGCLVFFCDDAGYGDQLAGRLHPSAGRVIKIRATGVYEKIDEYNYTLDLADPNGYDALLTDIKEGGHTIVAIVHCLGLGETRPAFEDVLDAGYLSLCYLAQASTRCSPENNIRLRVLTKAAIKIDGSDEVDPLMSMVMGALKVMSVEYDNLQIRGIDIRPEDTADEILAGRINGEIFDTSDTLLVAYRGIDRYIGRVEPVKRNPSGKKALRSGGCYVVTGGLGGMGLSVAEDMAAQECINLALIGRRQFPPKHTWDNWLGSHAGNDATSETIRKLKGIEQRGSRVMVISADVADFMQMRGVLIKIEQELGKINGIIWAAGIIDYGGVIQRRSKDQLISYIRSKVHGLLIAEKLLNFKELDWVVLFSSLGNLFYREKFGQVAYNVANEFLDAYAQSLPDVRISSINWCDWKEVGMTVNALNKRKGITSDELDDILKDGLSIKEGVDVFWQCLDSGYRNIIVSKKNPEVELKSYVIGKNDAKVSTAAPAVLSFERPPLSTPYREPTGPLETFLASLCRDLFGIRQVGADDNFLELGGDSLKAVRFINQVKAEKKIKVTLETFFTYPTIAGLARFMTAGSPEELYPLLPSQNRIFIINRLEPGQTSYNQVFVFRTNPIPPEKLHQAAQTLLQTHQVLRSCFTMVDGKPFQKFLSHVRPCIDAYTIEDDNGIAEIVQQFERPFDLSSPPLFRIGYVKNAKAKDYLLVDLYHIISDGISNQVFLHDLALLLSDRPIAAAADFTSYIALFNTAEVQEEIRGEERYWLEKFRDHIPARGLPTDYPRKPVDSKAGNRYSFDLPPKLSRQMGEIEKRERITPFVFNLAVLYVLLYKLTGDTDNVIGSTHFGRDYPGFEKVMGMFIETMALRNPVDSGMTFADFLRQVGRNTYRDLDNRKYPFESLIEKLGIPKSWNRNPLFDVVLSSVDLGGEAVISDDHNKASLEYIEQQFVTASFDILLTFSASKEVRSYSFEYNANLFKEDTIKSCGVFFVDILQQVVEDQDIPIDRIDLSGQSWEKAFHNPAYAGAITGHKALPILQQVELAARRNGDKTALIDGDIRLSYTQVMQEADKLAACLSEQYGIGRQDSVAVYLERSAYFVIAILGLLKIRAVFVPIDISMPEHRVKYILRQANCRAIITVTDHMFKFPDFSGPVFSMDIQMDLLQPAAPLPFSGTPDELAYVLFTSGSTGYPKGVKVPHLGLDNYITWANSYYFNNSDEYDLPLYTSVSFDFTLTSIFSPLSRGASIHICREGMDPQQTMKYIFSSGMRGVKITPAHIDVLGALRPGATAIEIAIVGGEELLPHQVSILRKLNPGMRIYNEYGPTEATVACSAALVSDSDNSITIGRPIDNARLFIADQSLRPLPPLVSGEILIAGDCLSAGYIEEEQNRDKFIEVRIGDRVERLYRSGDRGLYREDNELVYLGRIAGDEQIKIKGYRIELKEIEFCLMRLGKIDRSIVSVRKINGEDVIVAYYLASNELDEKRIRSYLAKFLPRQMIPSIIIRLEHLPLNANGKVDYEALPDPFVSMNKSYVPPVSEVELKLVEIWSEILGMEKEKIGLADGFFSLGGNSIKVVQLGQKIEDTFGITIPLAEFFDDDSVNAIIRKI